ncbi:MAG TPA: DNA glycosylase [Capsulimonadaceae bacterium]|jgi:N-glycosylase/DNA lyase
MTTKPRLLECDIAVLDLDRTLESGQVFRWKRDGDGWWVGLLEPSRTALRIRQTVGGIQIAPGSAADAEERLREYFRLGDNFDEHEATWRESAGPEIVTALDMSPGLRLIRQDPVECLFSFLTSAAAPIHRIRRCMGGLSSTLGEPWGMLGDMDLNAFPSVELLAATPREVYDSLGFGFRGGYIREAAGQILERGGAAWVRGLRELPYETAKAELMQLTGIGEKIADCVCLFSLDNDEAVPIDVHMARVARELFDGVPKSLTPKAYATVAALYRERFGPKAGWAQQYLYYAQIEKAGIWDDALGRHRK